MNRRSAVKNLVITSGGLISLPFWMVSCGISDKNTHATSFTAEEQQTIANIAGTIIPAGSAIGALSVGVDKYLQKLFDNCYEKQEQEKIKKQLVALETSANSAYGKPFSGCTPDQRQEILVKWSVSQNKEEKDFFDLIKGETIHGFNTSQKVMVDYLNYTIAPGHYYGCVTIKS